MHGIELLLLRQCYQTFFPFTNFNKFHLKCIKNGSFSWREWLIGTHSINCSKILTRNIFASDFKETSKIIEKWTSKERRLCKNYFK
jgi:hypothetical protein